MNPFTRAGASACGVIVAFAVCCGLHARAEQPKTAGAPAALTITSSAFPSGGAIPSKYACDGANVSPALSWTGTPTGTKSLALLCEDPDAPIGLWVHWVLYNLPATTSALAEKVEATATLPGGGKQGTNDFQKIGYGGPCPPPGKTHRYFFKLYALDTDLTLKPGATRKDLLRAMEHHIVAEGQLMGTYQHKK